MKSKTPPSKVNRLILEEASEWFVDFRVGDIDQQSRERFDEWLRRSPEHIRAYMDIARTYVELPSVKLSGKVDVGAFIAYARSDRNVVPFGEAGNTGPNEPHETVEPIISERQTSRARRTRRMRRYLVAASCALVVVVAGVVWWQMERFPSYATDIGERRSITLTDGSTVDLNARSKLRIEFTKNERRVELVDGQALFQVAKDKNRPFVVSSGSATVRAVGTQFDVYRKENGTTVTVLEGRVAVYSAVHVEAAAASLSSAPPAIDLWHAPAQAQTHPAAESHPSSETTGSEPRVQSNPPGLTDSSGSGAIFLSAGEQITVTPAEAMHAPAHADIGATTAWMQRRLIFDGSKLSDVAQEFNRYNRRQLIIDSAQLSDFHVSGVYSSSDPASLVRFLRDQAGIKISEDANEIRITAQ
jgi:transmembrane sensor